MLKHSFFLSLLVLLISGFSLTIQSQSLNTSVDLIGVASTDNTPFWIQSNRSGVIAPNGSHVMTRIQTHGQTPLFENPNFTFSYGGDLVARPGPSATLSFNQAYLKLKAYAFELAGGRFHNVSPVHDETLSMGSLGVSGNATPVPQIRFGLPDWTPLPLTREFIKIKVHLAHGWLGSNRYTDNVLYHEKVGHARFGGDFPLNIYGGIAHYAKWGGTNHRYFGELPAGFRDYFRVFFATSGGEDAPDPEADYMLGDHLGAWNFGFFLELDSFKITGYRQHPLETKDNLKLKSLQDALNGLSIRFDEKLNLPIRGLLYEFMYTKWQDGPKIENILEDGTRCSEEPEKCRDPFQGNENYYNHHIYRTGWANQERTIGNPLFRVSSIATPDLGEGIDNNRIIAHHIGADTQINQTNLIGKMTFSRNFGTRKNPFPEPADQFSIGLQAQTPVTLNDIPFTLLTDVAWDTGDLFGAQFGMMLGLRWEH